MKWGGFQLEARERALWEGHAACLVASGRENRGRWHNNEVQGE
jgi:hypothetical protein